MKKIFLFIIIFIPYSTLIVAQSVGINNTIPHASAILDIKSNTKGMLIPRTSSTSRIAIVNPAKGLMLYDTTTGSFWFYNGSIWTSIADGNNTWSLAGNTGINPLTHYIGTTDNQPLHFKINNTWAGEIHPTSGNLFLGMGAGQSNAGGLNNTAIGEHSLFAITTGTSNSAYGAYALNSNTTGSENTANGSLALFFNTTGSENTASGGRALYDNTTGNKNTANGSQALALNSTGNENTANGYRSLFSNTTGSFNTATGVDALLTNNTGSYNTAHGYEALYFNTTGIENVANGYQALYSNTTGSNNTANGFGALYYNTTGDSNTANGSLALNFNTTGNQNTANGYRALRFNTTGNNNTANGFHSLFFNTTGSYNTANGTQALLYNSTGVNNTANGFNALSSNTIGYNNTANGTQALLFNTSGNYNTANGSDALHFNTNGSFNIANGVNALQYNSNGNYNAANGYQALNSNTTGDNNTASGANSLSSNTTGDNNTAIGVNALNGNTTGNYNIAIGDGSGTHYSTQNIFNTISIGNDDILNAYQNQAFIGNTSTGWIGGKVTWSTFSDARIKNTITEDVKGLDFIMRLRPVTYHVSNKAITTLTGNKETPDFPGKYDNEKVKYTGFLAQEVEQAAKAAGYDFSGYAAPKNQWGLYTISYEQFVVPLVKAMQEQQKMIGAQQTIIEELKKQMVSKNTAIEKMELGKNRFTLYDAEQLLNDPSFHFTAYTGINNSNWMLGNNAAYLHTNTTTKNLFQWNVIGADAHRTSYFFTDSVNRQTWVTTMASIFLFDERTKTVYSGDPVIHPLLENSLFGDGERSSRFVMIDSRNNTWVTTWGDRLYRYDPVTKKISTYLLSAIKSIQQGKEASPAGLLINCMLEDNHNNIWLATENAGLLRYNREKDNFDYCIVHEKNSESIQYNYKTFTIFQDKEENIWVGTDKGISIFNPYRQYFRSIRHEENNSLSMPKNEIDCFIQTTAGDIFIGTWGGGMAMYDSLFHFKKNIFLQGPYEYNFIWCIRQVDDKTLWIGCQHGYLQVYDIASGTIQTLLPPEMERSTIRCMEKDNSGNIWFGLHNGKIVKWDNQQQKFFSSRDSLKARATVLNIFIDRAQNCWVSTEGGFKQFDLDKMIYTDTWLYDKKNATGISGKNCQGIEECNDSILLIGTTYGGLNFFNKRTKIFSHLTTADGLPSNSIYAIKKDVEGHIWFTTDYGLFKFNTAEKKFIPYSMEPGIINSSFTADKFYPLQDGQWLTFTASEVISFFPGKSAYGEMRQPKIEITGFKLFDKPVFIDSLLSGNKPLHLSYKENFFTVEFAALNFSSLQQINYYYRLGGVDKEWVNSGTKRFANYTDLQPGEYIFDVKAENGNSSGEITSFKIIITPPFWQTWWFVSLCVLLVVVTAYALIRRRIRLIRHEAKMKQTISETEMMALRAQMNPHFIFNCLNAIDNLIQTNQKEKATTYLAKFAKLIRSILDSSKNNVVLFQKDFESLQLYLQMEQFRCSNKFIYELKADEELLNSDYKLPPLIIQPFVENAILHGLLNKQNGDRKLIISAALENDTIKYTVTDNGVGRARAEEIKEINKPEHQSYGITITTERVHLYNQNGKSNDITITDLSDNGQPSGTKVEIRLKIYDN
jgi:ligand-binding sensor domain-containing protein